MTLLSARSSAETEIGLMLASDLSQSMRVGGYSWYVAVVLAIAQLMAGLDRYLMSVVLEPVKADLSLSDSQLGLLTGTSFALIFCVASIPLGRLSDIVNRRSMIAVGIAFWSASAITCGFANSFASLFIARLGIGLGEAALLPAAVSLLAAYFTPATLTQGLAVFTTGNSLGRAAAFLGGGALLATLTAAGGLTVLGLAAMRPWQGVMIIAGLTGVAVAFLCLTIREPARRLKQGDANSFRHSLAYFWLRRSTYLRLFLLYGLCVGSATALATWTISMYVRNYGVATSTASMIVGTVSLILGPLGNMLGGWLTDRLSSRGIAGAGMLVGSGALALTPFAGLAFSLIHSLPVAVVSYGLVYFALSGAGPACLSSVQMVTPGDHRGLISSLYLCVYSLIGFGLGPLAVGLANDFLFQSSTAIALSLLTTFLLFAGIGVPVVLSGRAGYQRHIMELRATS
jgi:MFS family permease